MAYIGPWGVFVHIPKCGGMAIRSALTYKYGRGKEIGDHHSIPDTIENGFALVRHPVDWHRSLWAYLYNRGWEINSSSPHIWSVIVDYVGGAQDWDSFVRSVTNNSEGLFEYIVNLYRHPNLSIHRLEDVGFSFPNLHATPNKPDPTEKQAAMIEQANASIMAEFGY